MEAANRFRSAEMMSQVVRLSKSITYGGGGSSLFKANLEREHYHYLLLIGQMNDVSAVTGPAPILEEEEEEDGDVAAEGVEDKDIELVMSQVTRILASKVSIRWLTFFPHSGKRL